MLYPGGSWLSRQPGVAERGDAHEGRGLILRCLPTTGARSRPASAGDALTLDPAGERSTTPGTDLGGTATQTRPSVAHSGRPVKSGQHRRAHDSSLVHETYSETSARQTLQWLSVNVH